MEPKKNGNGGGNKNIMGLVTILFWALILTLAINSLAGSLRTSNVAFVPYSTFYEWVEEGYVDSVLMENTEYTVGLKDAYALELNEETGEYEIVDRADGVTPQPEGGLFSFLAQRTSQVTTFYVTPLPVDDPDLLTLLRDMDVREGAPQVQQSSYLMNLLLSYVVPMALCMVFTLLWSLISARWANRLSPRAGGRVTGVVLLLLGVFMLAEELGLFPGV